MGSAADRPVAFTYPACLSQHTLASSRSCLTGRPRRSVLPVPRTRPLMTLSVSHWPGRCVQEGGFSVSAGPRLGQLAGLAEHDGNLGPSDLAFCQAVGDQRRSSPVRLEHLRDAQPQDARPAPDVVTFNEVTRPSMTRGLHAPGLRFGDARVMAVLAAITRASSIAWSASPTPSSYTGPAVCWTTSRYSRRPSRTPVTKPPTTSAG